MAKSLQFVLCLRQGKTKRACRREFYDRLNAQYREEINMLWEDAFRAAPQDADEAWLGRAVSRETLEQFQEAVKAYQKVQCAVLEKVRRARLYDGAWCAAGVLCAAMAVLVWIAQIPLWWACALTAALMVPMLWGVFCALDYNRDIRRADQMIREAENLFYGDVCRNVYRIYDEIMLCREREAHLPSRR